MSAYELRTYGVAPGKVEVLASIFRELVIRMLGDYDIESVGYRMTPAGDKLNYVVRHACLDAIEDNWLASMLTRADSPAWTLAREITPSSRRPRACPWWP